MMQHVQNSLVKITLKAFKNAFNIDNICYNLS